MKKRIKFEIGDEYHLGRFVKDVVNKFEEERVDESSGEYIDRSKNIEISYKKLGKIYEGEIRYLPQNQEEILDFLTYLWSRGSINRKSKNPLFQKMQYFIELKRKVYEEAEIEALKDYSKMRSKFILESTIYNKSKEKFENRLKEMIKLEKDKEKRKIAEILIKYIDFLFEPEERKAKELLTRDNSDIFRILREYGHV